MTEKKQVNENIIKLIFRSAESDLTLTYLAQNAILLRMKHTAFLAIGNVLKSKNVDAFNNLAFATKIGGWPVIFPYSNSGKGDLGKLSYTKENRPLNCVNECNKGNCF